MPDDTDEISNCPHCGLDLIYEFEGRSGSRAILVEISAIYDGGLYWMCPACGNSWHRWPVGHRLHRAALKYVRDAE